MAYTRPTFSAVKDRIFADFAGFIGVLREVLSVTWAKVVHSLHGHLEWIDAQCSPLTCELARLYDWATLYQVDRLDAVAASGNVIATGNLGAIVLANAILRGDNGLDYRVIQAVNLDADDNEVAVICLTAGEPSNLLSGQILTLVDPLAGVNSEFTVDEGGLTGGADQEDLEAWRDRVVDEWQVVVSRGARSGKDDDYRAWARSAHPSVTTALVQRHVLGMGTVLVRPICNALPNRQPTPSILAAIEASYLRLAPATADWRVTYPIVRAVVVDIDLFPIADTADNRMAIEIAINNTVLAETSETSVLAMAELDASIATVTTQYVRVAPLADIAVDAGEILVLTELVFS